MQKLEQIDCPPVPERPADGHKGTFGHVMVVGGSVGMSGSIVLTAKAALRSGSGLVTAAIPASIQSIVASFDPCWMTIGLPCELDGELQSRSSTDIEQLVRGYNAIGIGPGLGKSSAAAQIVSWVLSLAECPVVMDADALNVSAQFRIVEERLRNDVPVIITPHPGEFARLTGLTTQRIAEDRVAVAAEYAERCRVVVVLKGKGTVVTDGRQVYLNDTGNSGMATGGSGDVLTGVITSLLGQGMLPLEAAALAVHAHGLAGDLAAETFSERAMTAVDLVEHLSAAWRTMEIAGWST